MARPGFDDSAKEHVDEPSRSVDIDEAIADIHKRLDALPPDIVLSLSAMERRLEMQWARCEQKLEDVLVLQRQGAVATASGPPKIYRTGTNTTTSSQPSTAEEGDVPGLLAQCLQRLSEQSERMDAVIAGLTHETSVDMHVGKQATARSSIVDAGVTDSSNRISFFGHVLSTMGHTPDPSSHLPMGEEVTELAKEKPTDSAWSGWAKGKLSGNKRNASYGEGQLKVPTKHRLISKLARSSKFNFFCSLVALLAAVLCGMLADAEVGSAMKLVQTGDRGDQGYLNTLNVLQYLLLAWLFMELCINAMGYGTDFLFGPLWKCRDLVLGLPCHVHHHVLRVRFDHKRHRRRRLGQRWRPSLVPQHLLRACRHGHMAGAGSLLWQFWKSMLDHVPGNLWWWGLVDLRHASRSVKLVVWLSVGVLHRLHAVWCPQHLDRHLCRHCHEGRRGRLLHRRPGADAEGGGAPADRAQRLLAP
mmetsp:Transcript_2044/g.7919  ORF Transcript_2044/g.7919 Transcript_2044/m.7919 type:complete len:473 (+) Transcript_2044:57-1475(+)